jgi:ribose 5-phosphate isomerase A
MSQWAKQQSEDVIWGRPITNREKKERAAASIAKRLKKGDVVGVGSGSTSFLTLKALAQRRDHKDLDFRAIATSIEMELVCGALSIPTTSLRVEQPDWSFDGADEVDPQGNLIKGRGGAMLREKLLMKACPEVYIAVDPSKLVKKLGEKCAVPIEIQPDAIHIVQQALAQIDTVTDIVLRQAVAKDGPVITEYGNLILDVKFSMVDTGMESRLKSIVGVVETGLFIGYAPKIMVSE